MEVKTRMLILGIIIGLTIGGIFSIIIIFRYGEQAGQCLEDPIMYKFRNIIPKDGLTSNVIAPCSCRFNEGILQFDKSSARFVAINDTSSNLFMNREGGIS